MKEPVVEVFAAGEPPRERAVGPEGLRIGRLRENEVVLGGRSVSRRHAALRWDGERLMLEDAGSENGSYVNGSRVERSVALGPGDELRIGPHRIVIREGFRSPGREASADEAGLEGDAAEALAHEEASTLAPRGLETARAAAEDDGADLPRPVDAPQGGASSGGAPAEPALGDTEPSEPAEAELWLDAPADDDADFAVDPARFDVTPEEAGGDDLGGAPAAADPSPPAPEPEPPRAGAGPEAPGEAAAGPQPGPDGLYAGFVLQCEGRLDGVVPWEAERLAAGRGADCEIVLDRPEISRRHALFVRENGAYEVRDAGSANGTRVNGEPVERRRLELGDVVEIDPFALTFLLDAQPIESVVRTAALPSQAAEGASEETRFALADEGDGPLGALDAGDVLAGAAEGPAAEAGAPYPAETLPEVAEEDEEKELETAPTEDAEALLELSGTSAPAATGTERRTAPLRLELALDEAALPEPLREALRALGDAPLRLPVELRLRSEGDRS